MNRALRNDPRPHAVADGPDPGPSRRSLGWREWGAILLQSYRHSNEDRLLAVAAGVVFYGLLALFPAITALVSLYALFSDPATINDHLRAAADFLPADAFQIVGDQLGRIVAKGDVKLGTALLFSSALALWSANGGTKAVLDALNVVNDETEQRGFIKLNLVSLGFTAVALVAVLAAIGAVVALPIALSMVGLGAVAEVALGVGRWPALVAMILVGLALLYRFGPSRRPPRWRWISVGSVAATLTWIAGSAALSYYLSHFADYDATYGSLGAAIALMIWMWMSTIVVLFGAELNAAIDRRRVPDDNAGTRSVSPRSQF
jgi:membrane protein